MRLIGMLDSPYVRRVAIALTQAGIAFDHEPHSVFAENGAFAAINPLRKAPTLVADDGTVLMDSELILTATLGPWPLAGRDLLRALRLTGLALCACEKAVQIVYEHHLRPEDKRHAPWILRVTAQLRAAWNLLEAEIGADHSWQNGNAPGREHITIAVAWRFGQKKLADVIVAADYPRLAALSAQAEASAAFLACPLS